MDSIFRLSGTLKRLRAHVVAALIAVSVAPIVSGQNMSADTQASLQPPSVGFAERYPVGSINSVEVADRALQEIEKERSRIEAQYADDERACYPKFFTTACLDAAKEQRRSALAQIRPVEVEANAFKRRARVAERDKALAEQRARDEAEALNRAAKKEADGEPRSKKSTEPDRSAHAAEGTDRAARHQAKVERTQAEEAANAQKRAENVAAFEKKQRESQARQREIAAKKAEKERERAEKAVSAPKP